MRGKQLLRTFLPAAKPTGQGTESVVLLLLLCCCSGDHFHFTSLMYTQKGCEKKKLCQKNRCEKGKLLLKK